MKKLVTRQAMALRAKKAAGLCATAKCPRKLATKNHCRTCADLVSARALDYYYAHKPVKK